MGTDINNLYIFFNKIILTNCTYPLQLEHRENERLTEFGSLLKWVRLGELGKVKEKRKPSR